MSRDEIQAAYERISGMFPAEWDVEIQIDMHIGRQTQKNWLYDRIGKKTVQSHSQRPFNRAEITLMAKHGRASAAEYLFVDVASLSDADLIEAATALVHKVKTESNYVKADASLDKSLQRISENALARTARALQPASDPFESPSAKRERNASDAARRVLNTAYEAAQPASGGEGRAA